MEQTKIIMLMMTELSNVSWKHREILKINGFISILQDTQWILYGCYRKKSKLQPAIKYS
jgi:hypothetical protein